MNFRKKKRELHGVVGGAGLVAGLLGYIGGFYSNSTATVLMLGIWIVGATLVNLLTD